MTASHFRFASCGGGQIRVQRGPLPEGALGLLDRRPPGLVAQPAGVPGLLPRAKIQGPQEYMVRPHNLGGTHPQTQGQLYGLRDSPECPGPPAPLASAVCVEFKCSGMLFDQRQVDRTLVTVMPQGSCRRGGGQRLLQDYLTRHPHPRPLMTWLPLLHAGPAGPWVTTMVSTRSPTRARGWPRRLPSPLLRRLSDGFSREMKADAGTAVTFQCREPTAGRLQPSSRGCWSPCPRPLGTSEGDGPGVARTGPSLGSTPHREAGPSSDLAPSLALCPAPDSLYPWEAKSPSPEARCLLRLCGPPPLPRIQSQV